MRNINVNIKVMVNSIYKWKELYSYVGEYDEWLEIKEKEA